MHYSTQKTSTKKEALALSVSFIKKLYALVYCYRVLFYNHLETNRKTNIHKKNYIDIA